MSSNKENEKITFRLYQSIRFNRPIIKEKDCFSPGGYELKMMAEDGTEKTVKFDFEDYEGVVDDKDPCVLHCMQKNPDYSEFDDLKTLTEHMLRNVTEVVDWYIYTGEPDKNVEDPLIPVDIFDVEFEIIRENFVKIPMNGKIPLDINMENQLSSQKVVVSESGEGV